MASFQISPGVLVKEEDLTNVIPAVATSIGASVIDAQWGPIDEITIIDSVDKLISVFGQPVTRNYKDWFCARNFLAYGKDLRLIRIADATGGITNSSNLSSPSATLFVKNTDDFDSQKDTLEAVTGTAGIDGNDALTILGRYAGAKGNDITVSYCSSAEWDNWDYADLFDFAPTAKTGEFMMVIFDGGILVEKWFLNVLPGYKDEEGNSNYVGILNNQSKYVRVIEDNLVLSVLVPATLVVPATTVVPTETSVGDGTWAGIQSWPVGTPTTQEITLVGGADMADGTDLAAETQAGWDIFANAEDIEINLLFAGGASPLTSKYIIENVAEVRKDCVAFVSPDQADVVNNAAPAVDIVVRRTGDDNGTPLAENINVNSSYAVMDGNYKYQFDPFNEVYRWVPLNGDIAGLAARTDNTNDPWWSFAGLNRGQIKNVVKLAFRPSKAQRDELYKHSINPVVSFPGEGTVLWGDRTMLMRPSAFRHVNVRRLFIILEKAIATAAKYTLFEFNDPFTRARFVQQVEPFLRDIQSRRGIIANDLGKDGFYVVADERVNTPEVINNNEFRARIMIKPARSINFIELTFTAVNNGVDFEEIIVPA